MALSEVQARLRSKVWQGVAQSGVDLSAIPQAEMDTLVNAITDGVLQEIDTIMGEANAPQAAAIVPTEDGEAEPVLWEGRPFLSFGVRYQVTTERVRIVEGVLGKDREDIELIRLQDIDQTQSLGERMLNIGDLHLHSHDTTSPEVVLRNIANPVEVHEILRRAVLEARKRHGLTFREHM